MLCWLTVLPLLHAREWRFEETCLSKSILECRHIDILKLQRPCPVDMAPNLGIEENEQIAQRVIDEHSVQWEKVNHIDDSEMERRVFANMAEQYLETRCSGIHGVRNVEQGRHLGIPRED